MATLFCFGYGFCARALAERLRDEGFAVIGTERKVQSRDDVITFDGTAPIADFAARLQSVSHVLISIPPTAEGDVVLRRHGADLARQAKRLTWVGYLSTTGVYGDRQGGWVDETSALEPTGARGRRRIEAEAGWLSLHAEAGLPVHVFRLAGIYGPGRNPLRTLREGRAQRIDKPGQVFSRIHVEDVASVLAASIARPAPGRIYNVCDDAPAPPAEVVAYGAALLGVEPPPLVAFNEAGLSAMAASFYRDNKRVRNDRIKHELGVRLRYPSYREGLRALLPLKRQAGS